MRRWARAAAVVLIGLWIVTAPASAQVFNAETITLQNGLQVVVVPNHRAPILSHMVWYKIGAADEVQGHSGIAHFLEHLMFKGTDSVPPGQFSKIVARNGGRDNAFTSHDYTAYFQNVARDRLELVMKLEADRMANLVLSDAVVYPERDVILEERRQRIDNEPGSRLREQVQAALFLNHPYGRPIIGWEHEMKALTREDAVAFYRQYYAPNNAILVVAGDITMAELKPLAEATYGKLAPHAVPARVRPQEPPPQAERRVVLKDPRVRQPSWSRSYIAPTYTGGDTKLAYPLQVLVEILGGGVTGRLHQALVVDRSLANSANAWYDVDAMDPSTFGIAVSPRPGVDMAEVEKEVEAVLRRLLAEGVSEDEVARAKNRMIPSAIFARDSLQTGARVIGEALAVGLTVADVEAWPERVNAVTKDQVNAAAKAVLREVGSVTALLLPQPSS